MPPKHGITYQLLTLEKKVEGISRDGGSVGRIVAAAAAAAPAAV
jgi:hypothetical protein